MTVDEASLDSFGQLAKAIGLLEPGGGANSSWFTDPVGAAAASGGNQHGLRHLLADDAQRDALLSFVDEVLGPPDRTVHSGQTWVPLFRQPEARVTISAVVAQSDGEIHLGVGLEHTTAGGPPRVSTRVHVPVFRFARRSGPALTAAGDLPSWLLLGRPGGRVSVGIEATFTDTAPAPGAASLGGVSLALGIPTTADDDLAVALELRDLQLPGARSPRTFRLDAESLDELGADVFSLVVGLVRAQANALDLTLPTLRPFAAVAGLLGLRDVAGLAPLPLADLPTRGLPVLVEWVEGVLNSGTARAAWLGQLALLVDGHVDPGSDAVTVDIGPMRVAVGLRVSPGTGGHPALIPFVALSFDTRAGVRARLAADLLRADTGTGACTALPDARLEAVFGADAGGAALLSGGDPHVGSLHLGVALDAAHRPAFLLTLHDVTVGGRAHAVLDLSSPRAALDSATSVVEGALAAAIAGLGPAGVLVNRLVGLDPPAGVPALNGAALFADPLAAILGYWRDLTASAAAGADVLGRLSALVTGGATTAAPGTGTVADPWRVPLAGSLGLTLWRDGNSLAADLGAAVRTPVFDGYEVRAEIGLTLLRVDLAAGRVAFATEARGGLALARADATTARLRLGAMSLEADRLAAVVSWAPGRGLRAVLAAPGLALVFGGPGEELRVPFELPTVDSSGRLALPSPDWDALERVLGALLAELRLPVVDALLDLVGWRGVGAHLSLSGLLGTDPGLAVRAWLADLVLNCDRVRVALGPVAALLSGFHLGAPIGSGNARGPYRCPVAGEPRAPGLAVWLDPGCPPEFAGLGHALGPLLGREPPSSAAVVAVLRQVADDLPDLADLLVGRDSLATGFDQLVARWAGTDGLIGRPGTLPAPVTAVPLPGLPYDQLVALGSAGLLDGLVVDGEPTAVVHVGCEASWAVDRPAGTAFDRSAPDRSAPDRSAPDSGPTATVPSTGDGTWFVRLPMPAVAATARPDRGGVGEQAARLAAVLAGRTDPVTVIAYGAAGAAAVRAAATVTAVSQVVTVGTPWAGVATDALRGGLSGDALRFLARLRRPEVPFWKDALFAREATPQEQGARLVHRAATMARADEPPSAAGETIRSGLTVRAAFGDLDRDTLAKALGQYVAGGLAARAAAAAAVPAGSGVITALHAAVDLPVIDLNLAGLLVGAGVTVELCRLGRGSGGGLEASLIRGVIVDLHLGVHDGWLVGGPGSSGAVGDLRWMSARVQVPLDGRPGDAELVLHEARGFGVDRERWVVRADPAGAAADVTIGEITTAVPEVRALLSDVVARLRAGSADLAGLLDLLGVTRAGGLDADGLDRLLHDTVATVRGVVAAAPAELAVRLRGLIPAAAGTGSRLQWTVGPAQVGVDLATGAVEASLRLSEPGPPPIEVDAALSATGASARLAVGALDPDAGGLRLVGRAASGSGPAASLAMEWAGPRAPVRTVALLPHPDPVALTDLATVVLPAVAAHALLSAARELVSSDARAALDAGLDAVGLLAPPDVLGGRSLVVPVGLLADPGGWLRHATAAWRTNAAASAVALLDALAPLVVPARGSHPGWPLADGLALLYAVEDGHRLRLLVDLAQHADLGGTTVTTHLAGGLVVGPDALPAPALLASVDLNGRGLRLAVDPAARPPVRLDLIRPAPAAALPLYPDGPGLGQALSAVGETVLPVVLDAIAGHRTDAPSLARDVGQVVFDLGGALDLLESSRFSGSRITAFAADPAAALLARLPQIVVGAVASLATALDPAHTRVSVTGPTGNRVTLGFGSGTPVRVLLDASGPTPAVEIQADVTIAGVGRFALEHLRLSAAGVDVAARLGPVVLDVGAFALRPLLVVRAGSAVGSGRLVGIGLALDDLAARSVEFRWGLDSNPPTLAPVTRTSTGESVGDLAEAAQWLLALALSLAGGVVVEALGPVLTTRARAALRGVVFTDADGSDQVDPVLGLDLFEPEALLRRLKRLLWNCAQLPLTLTIDGLVTIGLVSHDLGGGRQALGLSVSLASGRRLTLADGDTKVELEVDATWVHPEVPAGLAVYVLAGTSAATLDLVPGVSVAGLGVRFTKSTGPLLSLGAVSLDGIAVHLYGEANPAGVGGGVNLELAGLAFAPSGGGGGNAVANGILTDAGRSSGSGRPAFSPSLAVQQHPGQPLAVSLRAGPPPGPWWIVIQRQLGPLYLERVGFNTVETAGTVSRISLLFDGQVSIFGLTAAVDQLSLTWLGGDVLDISSWSVDLMGLAISADMAGVSLAGGILKTVEPAPDNTVSYVGMLLGRFGTYGLSVFGGYTDDHGSPSFFVFGAINGPIGGPPAFFLTGIGGGLGINRGLRIPDDPARFNEFPFITALDPAARPPANPMAELHRLSGYFPVQRGNFWFAAGISFNSFALVDGIAVIAVSFGDGLEIDLLGLARMALPRPEAALISIELGLLARFSTREGLFMIRAGLTENSWLLYPDVRLTGGFAFAIWWKGPLAGQFVMTLGGYHPDFHRDGYPDVPRLGLMWRVSDAIVIKGGAYFALTSEALMAGVDVEVSADFGFAWARIAFGAHGLVYFDPFWFEVMAYARISAGVKIETFLGTISFSISVGASVKVWGPDFSGEATLEVGPASISVGFGSEHKVEPRTLEWPEFVAKYLEDAGEGRARALSAITGRGTLPAATGGDRAAPTSDGSAERPYEVYAEFELTVVTTVPTSTVDLGLATGTVALPVTRSDGMGAQLGLKPMRTGDLSSTLTVILEKRDDRTGVWSGIPEQLRLLGANLAAPSPRPEGSGYGRDAFPIGAWGAPEPSGATQPPLPKGDVLFAGNRLRLVAEAQSLHRGPEIDYYKVVASRRPLPLQAGGSARPALLAEAGTVAVPHVSTAAAALAAAQARLFAPAATTVPAGMLPTGPRSALARASYAGEMAAPPLFGTLADGLAPANAADAGATRVPPAPTPPVRGTRPPVIAGYLTAGDGAAIRAAATTVADTRPPRVTAPTLDAVKVRIGAALPVQLNLTSVPSAVRNGTLVSAVPPRTGTPGGARSYPQGSSALAGLVAGIEPAPSATDLTVPLRLGLNRRAAPPSGPRRLSAGEVVVLALPDASVDTGRSRPVLGLDGPARVVLLHGDGTVLADTEPAVGVPAVGVTAAGVPVPPGTALVAVQADGSVSARDGLAGWHVRSRVCGLGSHAALAPGCVLTTEGGPSPAGVAWTTAGELVSGAAAVLTRFGRAVHTVALVVEAAQPDRLDGLALELIGADRVPAAGGGPRPPTVLLGGGQAVLAFAVRPHPDAPEGLAVRSRSGGDWHVTGVLGGDLDPEELARLVVRDGIVAATGRMLAATGQGCGVTWSTPDGGQ